MAGKRAKIILVARHNDAILFCREGQYELIGCSPRSNLVDVNRVEAVRHAQMRRQHWGPILIDQEARRHGLPGGRPRGGLASA